jgi:hypothetical protein
VSKSPFSIAGLLLYSVFDQNEVPKPGPQNRQFCGDAWAFPHTYIYRVFYLFAGYTSPLFSFFVGFPSIPRMVILHQGAPPGQRSKVKMRSAKERTVGPVDADSIVVNITIKILTY